MGSKKTIKPVLLIGFLGVAAAALLWIALAASGEATAAFAQSNLGTRENPVPMNQYFRAPSSPWELKVLSVDWDAWPEISAAASHADPPATGKRYITIEIAVRNKGSSPDNFDVRSSRSWNNIGTVGNSSVAQNHGDSRSSCWHGALQDGWHSQRDIFPNGTQTGKVCFEVPIIDLDSLLLYGDYNSLDLTDRTHLNGLWYWSLRATAVPTPTVEPTATPVPTVEPTATPESTAVPTATPAPDNMELQDAVRRITALESAITALRNLVTGLTNSVNALTARVATLESSIETTPVPTSTPAPSTPVPTPTIPPTATPPPDNTPVPSATPGPTVVPTATPTPSPCELITEEIFTFPLTKNSSWITNTECLVDWNLDNINDDSYPLGNRYVREATFFPFSDITLTAQTDSETDTVLLLWEWNAQESQWKFLNINDDVADGDTNSRIRWSASADQFYRVSITTYQTETLGDFTLTITSRNATTQSMGQSAQTPAPSSQMKLD